MGASCPILISQITLSCISVSFYWPDENIRIPDPDFSSLSFISPSPASTPRMSLTIFLISFLSYRG